MRFLIRSFSKLLITREVPAQKGGGARKIRCPGEEFMGQATFVSEQCQYCEAVQAYGGILWLIWWLG